MDCDVALHQLVLVDIVSAHGVAILQTVWAPVDNLRHGRRETRHEQIGDQAQLLARLATLVPLLDLPSAAWTDGVRRSRASPRAGGACRPRAAGAGRLNRN